MADKKDYNIALLIDGDNISHEYIVTLLDELKNYGRLAYKRIYGDFTSQKNSSWSTIVKKHGIIPVQEYACIAGKNTTDFALVIDAMDILYSKNVDCFCILSSDSDFARLVQRLRENGIFVIGAGEAKTNKAYINNYDRFIMIDQLSEISNKKKGKAKAVKQQAGSGKVKSDKRPNSGNKAKQAAMEEDDGVPSIDKIYDCINNVISAEDSEDGWAYVANVFNKLYKEFPEFNVKLYERKNTIDFLQKAGIYDIKRNESSVLVKIKENKK